MSKRQVIKYENTKVPTDQSVHQIMQLCRKYGATRFEMLWDSSGRTRGVRFSLNPDGNLEIPVRLEVPYDRIAEILIENRRPSAKTPRPKVYALAEKIAWRHMKDLIEQTLLSVHLGLTTPVKGFLQHMEDADGRLLGNWMEAELPRLLEGGK